jgi:diguanylate cyclase (GGDEF)-like protein
MVSINGETLKNEKQETTRLKRELKNAFTNYLEAYLVHRDRLSTYAMFSPTLTGFGNGINERGYTLEDMTADYQRDFEQAPNSISYTLQKIQIQPISDSIGIVFGELDILTTISDQSLHINNLRISIVFQKIQDTWKLEHTHISSPAQLLTKSESAQLHEREQRVLQLEKLVQEKTKEVEATRLELEKLTETDHVTGLYNRMKLEEILSTEIQRAKRYGNIFSIILFNLDNFNAINDSLGHQVGDQILIDLANIISHRVRETDKIGRWNNDEFMIIAPETNLEDAALLAEITRVTLENHEFGITSRIASSFGVTCWMEQDTYNSLIDRVNNTLYQAKHNGKNQKIS